MALGKVESKRRWRCSVTRREMSGSVRPTSTRTSWIGDNHGARAVRTCVDEKAELEAKIVAVSKDQDDLLELLADQDLKMKNYRAQLRQLGQQIEASDDEN